MKARKTGKTLKIFVMGPDPRALKSVELANWTGQAFIGRRDHMKKIKERKELNEPGVYLLLSEASEETGVTQIYVGETDNFQERIMNHVRDSSKDWWSHFVVFVSKDQNLTKAHVRFLERQLHSLALEAIGTLECMNKGNPSGASLPESDIASMNEFFDNIIFVLETLSLSYFPSNYESQETENEVDHGKSSEPADTEGMKFMISLPRDLVNSSATPCQSIMEVRGGAYILKAGSYIRKKERDSFIGQSYHQLWRQIINSDAVKNCENPGLLETVKDIEFRSPSGAGAIVRGGQTNGRTEWKRVSDSLSLSECELEAAKAV